MMNTLRQSLSLALALVLGVFVWTGCDDSGSNAEATGSMNLRLTDAPIDSATAVNVTIEEIVLIRSDADDEDSDADDGNDGDADDEESRVPVYNPDTPQTINLLEYQNSSLQLAEGAEVPAGTYSQMRLVLTSDNEIVFPSGTEPLRTPSAQQSGYKINLPEIIVNDDSDEIDLTLDFDASQSVVATGANTFLLKPTITPTSVQFNGEVLDETVDTRVDGALTNVNTSGPSLTVEGIEFTATGDTEYEGVSAIDGLSSYSYASVEATENDDGTFTAVEVEAVNDGEQQYILEGAVDAVGTSVLTLLDTEVQVTTETVFEEGATSLSGIATGAFVEVEFTKDGAGTRTATRIEVEDEN